MEKNVFEPFVEPNPAPQHLPVTPFAAPSEEKKGDVVIVTDCEQDNEQLSAMIERFRTALPLKTRVVSIRDHSMGACFKLYDDRQFCNGHRTVTMGMPMGYLVSGDYSRERNLQTIIEARAQVGGNFLAGVATDEQDPDAAIDRLAASLSYAIQNRYAPPQNFFGVGGMKIFRDLIWIMQGMMKADHRFYKAHGQYDFPQKQWPTMLKMHLVGALISSPKVQAKIGSAMTEGMLALYKKVLSQMDEQKK